MIKIESKEGIRNALNNQIKISENTPIYDSDPQHKTPIKALLVIRENEVAISRAADGRYGFFGDMNAIYAKIFYGLCIRLISDQRWYEEHMRWMLEKADQIRSSFEKDAKKSKVEELKKFN